MALTQRNAHGRNILQSSTLQLSYTKAVEIPKRMNTLPLNPSSPISLSVSYKFSNTTRTHKTNNINSGISRGRIRAAGTVPDSEDQAKEPQEPRHVDFAFVHSVLLPDGTLDVHYRKACGGGNLRNIMLDSNIDLYGPYVKPLSNCVGGGTCGTCLVEVVEGKELLTPRTEIEKEKLKKKPKTFRLACQTTVGDPNSTGLVVIQQLPEWKGHEWYDEKVLPSELEFQQ